MTQPIIGQQLPEFSLQAFIEDKFLTVTQDDLKGTWGVFFFYPADFTFVCPTELGDLADQYATFQGLGVRVYSVSTDTHFTHKAWHDASDTIKKIKYPMLADPTGSFSRAFGVYDEQTGLDYRGTFVVNPEGNIVIAEVNDNGIGRNVDELLRKVKAAQYIAKNPNEVCPAKWEEGSATLTPELSLIGKL
ncbi:MAG: alkyl hydroperoxide reductase subunit C, partial [Candidatus Marinamargulisbacteria bacterium]|jgi:NADH-dependent peroxiredoxin subunit C|nr:peroxiredoxin [bacterium]MDG2264853.1 alkyl hydroperoxide reductase subunit C [Candidatus Marinamargulisbacteria bacterium]|tara:strand:+ start:784 stop:1353 length:570 start_codon:yes stop_codon:yes gene_type:complete